MLNQITKFSRFGLWFLRERDRSSEIQHLFILVFNLRDRNKLYYWLMLVFETQNFINYYIFTVYITSDLVFGTTKYKHLGPDGMPTILSILIPLFPLFFPSFQLSVHFLWLYISKSAEWPCSLSVWGKSK